ncbi:hypothetical protein JOF28_000375 [Leucobacter exalbidus]|uniref:Uncharacterized protein n=1 Tax=Leucobacter exalbidus TaxID=662960 RepID=A0A940T2T7_9MICO|nr:hypothetical protein [Leucobacter exalbidus]
MSPTKPLLTSLQIALCMAGALFALSGCASEAAISPQDVSVEATDPLEQFGGEAKGMRFKTPL